MIRVVVADDHDFVRQGVVAVLENAGDIMVVGSCANGQQAVDCVARARPDVILMDLSMPVLDGVEATRRILAQDSSARIVILTSGAGGRRVNDARAAGAVDCIYKNVDTSEMLRAVRHAASPSLEFVPTLVSV